MFIKKLGRCLFLTAVISSIALGDWKSDANTRIENIRKRNAQITLVNSLGQPVSGINVQIELVNHHFVFGTCIRSSQMSNTIYKNFILSHFNWAVCENDTKWKANEYTRNVVTYTNADTIYTWCNNNGIKMRGHCLFWEQENSEFPDWLAALGYATYPTASELLGEVDERIDSAVTHFKGKFYNWDVDNEMLTDNFFTSRLGSAGIVHMFNAAKALDPDCGMFMNEYNGNSFGGYSSTNYVNRANTLIGLGATIDGYGIQGHLAENVSFQPQSYYDNVLQPLAVFGKPIWATEFDASHTDATISADNIENYLRICFSHANVEGVMFWGFMNGQMWRTNAGLCDSSGNLTVQGVRYEALMDEWTTEDDGITDVDGNVDFRGFHGTYEITLSATGQSNETYTIELEPGTTTAQFEIQTNLHSPEPEYIPPTPNPMTWASVPTATGQSTITMTATTATDDSLPVQYYFECTTDSSKNSGWQTSTTYIATGLNPNTLYSFRVKARDNAQTPNETGWSAPASARTMAPGANVELLGSWTTGLNHAKETGTNRILVFVAHGESSGSSNLTSVSYGGKLMTKIIEADAIASYSNQTAVFVLNDADITSAIATNFSPTWSSTMSSVSYASAFFSNVNQAALIGAYAGNNTTSGTNPITTSALSTDQGDMVIVAAVCGNNGSYTLNNGFTEGTDQSVSPSSGHTGVTGHKSATGVAETPSATYSSTVNRQAIIGMVIKAVLPTYQTCEDVQNGGLALLSDLSGDCYVNFGDLEIMSDYWLSTDCAANSNCEGADFEPTDGTVDFLDFGDFAVQWMQCNDPQDSSCTQNW
ncbi:MAG: endo-1,4-beta-xylanase [Phycisphaerae bacterium]|jgi:GH35 family endo-1,4-beta-xylanase